ncbi:DMT family transporter [Solirhodobacter olei]|uniref:DMT family transporter n=1 Tax=Solirhodobacter olei TaxID=2493082 RepID=UPI000FD779BC|nr:DMT family transporter [Solirhodobacter olei]
MSKPADRIPLGVAFMLGFCALAPLIDVFSKLAAETLSVGEVTLARYIVQAALMIPMVALMGQSFRLTGRALWLTVVRAVVSLLSTYCFVAAIHVMPLADALAIVFVEPFIILLLGWTFYGEPVGPRRLGAAAVGFLGSLLVIQPSFSAFGPVALFPLGTALGFALYILVTRQLAPLQHPVAMQAHTAIVAALIWLPAMLLVGPLRIPSMAFGWPSGVVWVWLFGVGLMATISHMSMSFGLRLAPATALAPLHYLELVTATTFGYLVFGNFPDLLTWAGIAVICASGLYIIHRERVIARRPIPGPATLLPEAALPAEASPASTAQRN